MDGLKGLGAKKPFHLRMPNSLRSTLETRAKLSNRSLNAQICLLLEESISALPVIEMAPAITEELGKIPFGIRFQDSLKASLQDAAVKCGRALNTEIVVRLLIATGVGKSDAEIKKIMASGPAVEIAGLSKIEVDLIATWERLDRAIEAMLSADPFELSNAATELKKAKAEYERLLLMKQLVLSTALPER